MIIPVRCFTCGTVVASAYEQYTAEMETLTASGVETNEASKQALNNTPLTRFCCRRMIIAHTDLLRDAAPYA